MNKKILLLSMVFSAFFFACEKSNSVLGSEKNHTIEGKVQCINGNNLKDVSVVLTTDSETLTTSTDASGHFSFSNVKTGENVKISAELKAQGNLKITTTEMLHIAKFLQDVSKVKSNLENLACDFDRNGLFNNNDILRVRESILGMQTLENQFIIVSDAFDKGIDTNKNISFNNISEDKTNLLFLGTNLGDPKGQKCK